MSGAVSFDAFSASDEDRMVVADHLEETGHGKLARELRKASLPLKATLVERVREALGGENVRDLQAALAAAMPQRARVTAPDGALVADFGVHLQPESQSQDADEMILTCTNDTAPLRRLRPYFDSLLKKVRANTYRHDLAVKYLTALADEWDRFYNYDVNGARPRNPQSWQTTNAQQRDVLRMHNSSSVPHFSTPAVRREVAEYLARRFERWVAGDADQEPYDG